MKKYRFDNKTNKFSLDVFKLNPYLEGFNDTAGYSYGHYFY